MSNPEQKQSDFLQRTRQLLNASEEQLDADTLRDLRQARYTALERLQRPQRLWQPVALTGALAMLVLVVFSIQHTAVKPPAAAGAMEDMTILSSGDNLDMYENLDFYQWLDQEKHNG